MPKPASGISETERKKPQELANGSGDFGTDFPDYTWKIEVQDTVFEFLKKIEVSVSNKKMAAHNVYQLELYRLIKK